MLWRPGIHGPVPAVSPSCFFDISDKMWENLFMLLAVRFKYFAAGGPPLIGAVSFRERSRPPFLRVNVYSKCADK
jgi:hypothetical protein